MVTETQPTSDSPAEPIQEVVPEQEVVEQPAPEAELTEAAPGPEPTIEELRAELAQLRADFAAKGKEAEEAFERGRRKGQGDLDSEVAAARKAEAERIERSNIADQLESIHQKALDGDTEANERFLRLMADARYHDIWRGRLKERSGVVDVAQAQADALKTLQMEVYANPQIKILGEKLLSQITDDSPTWDALFVNIAMALAEKEVAKRLLEEKAETEKAVASQVRAEEHAKAGEVKDVKGHGSGGALTPARYKAMSDEERAKLSSEEIDSMTGKYLT